MLRTTWQLVNKSFIMKSQETLIILHSLYFCTVLNIFHDCSPVVNITWVLRDLWMMLGDIIAYSYTPGIFEAGTFTPISFILPMFPINFSIAFCELPFASYPFCNISIFKNSLFTNTFPQCHSTNPSSTMPLTHRSTSQRASPQAAWLYIAKQWRNVPRWGSPCSNFWNI